MAIEKYSMTIDHALDILEDCKRIYRLLGNQSSYPYHPEQMVRASLTVLDNYDATAVPEAEHVLLKRQYAALNARHIKLQKETGKHGTDTTDVAEGA